MEEVFAVIGVLALAAFICRRTSKASALVSTPAPAPPSSTVISSHAKVSGGYQLVSSATMLSSGSRLSSAQIPSTVPPPALPGPPPSSFGGIAGNAATGGNPLGDPLRPGITAGPATTVIGSRRFVK